MPDDNTIPVPSTVAIGAWIDEAKYFRLYEESLADPDKFWGEQGKRLDWIKPYTKVKNTSFTGDVSIKWFEDGTLNASLQLRRPASARRAPTRPRSCGRATTRTSSATSPMASCTTASAASPM